jgi:hypothetical protein
VHDELKSPAAIASQRFNLGCSVTLEQLSEVICNGGPFYDKNKRKTMISKISFVFTLFDLFLIFRTSPESRHAQAQKSRPIACFSTRATNAPVIKQHRDMLAFMRVSSVSPRIIRLSTALTLLNSVCFIHPALYKLKTYLVAEKINAAVAQVDQLQVQGKHLLNHLI